nr:helix-turn-helix domain-containing protein [Chloroflexota bacterium]
LALARALYDGGQTDVATICQTLGISRATLYRHLRRDTTHDPADPSAGSPPPRARRSRGGRTSEG